MTTQAEFIQANAIQGALTPELAVQMMSLPEGDTSNPLETDGQPAATTDETKTGTAAQASLVKTEGMRRTWVGRLISFSHGKSSSSTSLYKNSSALKAWLCVDADTLRSVASMVKKPSTCLAPMSRGCVILPFRPCQRT